MEGNLINEIHHYKEIEGGLELLFGHQNYAITAGFAHSFDVGEAKIVITKIDALGHNLFNTELSSEIFHNYLSAPKSIDIDSEERIIIAVANDLVKLDKSGNHIATYAFDYAEEIINLSVYDNENYILSTPTTLFKMDSSGILTDSISFVSDTYLENVVHKDTIYQLFSNKIVVFDKDLNEIQLVQSALDIQFSKLKNLRVMFGSQELMIIGFIF